MNVTTAPSTLPCGLAASATAIITVTYNQPITTRYIGLHSEN